MNTIHSLKNVAKAALGSIAARLPYGARQTVFERLCEKIGPTEVVAMLAPRLGINAIVASGEYGNIQSAPTDTSVFATYARTGTWAKSTNHVFIEFFRKRNGGLYLDIGANIGLTTIPISKNPHVFCMAFEPDPVNFHNLTVNVAANCPHGNVKLEWIAVYDRRCTVALELADRNLGDHYIHPENVSACYGVSRRAIQVPAAPLDELVGDIRQPLAIKCDTQGTEPLVIAGGKDVLSHADLIVIEFWPYGMARVGSGPENVLSILAGFQVTILPKEYSAIELPPPTAAAIELLSDLARQHLDDPAMYWDLICTRR